MKQKRQDILYVKMYLTFEPHAFTQNTAIGLGAILGVYSGL